MVSRIPPASGNMMTAGQGPSPSGTLSAAGQVPSLGLDLHGALRHQALPRPSGPPPYNPRSVPLIGDDWFLRPAGPAGWACRAVAVPPCRPTEGANNRRARPVTVTQTIPMPPAATVGKEERDRHRWRTRFRPSSTTCGIGPSCPIELRLTDGLPVAPPLHDVVEALIAGSGRPADDLVAIIPPRDGRATVEVIAANAAMAGARPEHMPVIIAALEAMSAPEHNLRGLLLTTHPCWPLVIVSGDEVQQLGMATAEQVFSGGGNRANVAIGRAVKLVLWNVGGTFPGEPVKEVFGQPGRFAYCIAESADSPWEPFHRSRGLDAASGVTVFSCDAPTSVSMWGCDDEPPNRLAQAADAMSVRGSNNTHTMGQMLVVFTPSEARHLAARGYGRAEVQATLFQQARRRLGAIRPRGPLRPDNSPEHWYSWWPQWVDQSDDDTLVPVVEEPGGHPRDGCRRRQHSVDRRLPLVGPPRRVRRHPAYHTPLATEPGEPVSYKLVDPRGIAQSPRSVHTHAAARERSPTTSRSAS